MKHLNQDYQLVNNLLQYFTNNQIRTPLMQTHSATRPSSPRRYGHNGSHARVCAAHVSGCGVARCNYLGRSEERARRHRYGRLGLSSS